LHPVACPRHSGPVSTHRPNTALLAVLWSILCSEGALAAWDYLSWVDIVPESRWEIADLVEEGLLDQRAAEALLIMADDPADLTLAPAEVFRATTDIWFGEADAVVRGAVESGWFESLAAAARQGRLTPPELRRLRLLAREPQWEAMALIKAPPVAGDGRVEIELDPEGREDPAGLVRGRAHLWGLYRAGLLAVEDDVGGSVVRKYYVGAEPSHGLLRKAVVGTYRVSFGEGLVLSNYRRGAHGVFYDTIKKRRYKGVAVTSGAGKAEWTVLYSKERRDVDGEVEEVIGANFQGDLGARWRAGLTFCRTDDNEEPVDNVGGYWRGSTHGWHMTGEVGRTGDGEVGAYGELQRAGGLIGVRASIRHYGKEFVAPQGAPFADADGNPDAQNETGFYLEGKTTARGWYGLRWSCDVWGTASLDSLKGEASIEAVTWHGGWELSGRALHRREELEGGSGQTRLSGRVRREWHRLAIQTYGRMADPGGTGYLELSGAIGLGRGLAAAARGKIDLSRRVGGTSWHEILLTGEPWHWFRFRVGHRLGWERAANGRHERRQVLRAEVNAAL